MSEIQLNRIYRGGIGEHEFLMTVPKTRFLLRCTAWKNGNFKVVLIDPDDNWEKSMALCDQGGAHGLISSDDTCRCLEYHHFELIKTK